ncbi:hypothetical protein BKA62DRAFT_662985 [Auriculariales sp. MPI-PUGE-AT-0066]|nr:hypothetical protein BKA62DRAFT_662985 [Auriculariales sp. MPI-PUGE-AT-0066]
MHPLTDHTVQSFDNVPEELVLRILRNVPADDVHSNVGSTSKRLRRIAQDAPLWEALCSEILTENSVNALSCARFDREIWCPSSSQTTLFEFWGLYLRYWAPRLGWWLDASESTDKKSSDGTFVSSILADLASGVIVFQHLYLRAGMHRPGHNVNELLEDLPQNVERPEIFLGAIRIFGHLPTNNRWDVQLMHAELAQVDVIASLWDEHSKQNHSFSREVGVSSPLSLAPRVLTTDLDIGTLVRPFPKV